MRVVIVGAGKLGCGYLAPLFQVHGHQVVLGCRTDETARRILTSGGSWRVRVTGSDEPDAGTVSGVRPVVVGRPEFTAAVAVADLVVTSVGVGNVESLGNPLATAFAARTRPIDVWVVENADCAPTLAAATLAAAAAHGLRLPSVTIAGAVATVAVSRGSWLDQGTPEFVGDHYRRLTVDGAAALARRPALIGVNYSSQYLARLHEKLFVFNSGHALTAYLGWLRGHRTVAQSITDPFVRPLVAGALLEARRAILATYPRLVPDRGVDQVIDVHAPVAEALARYADAELADPVQRVARDPVRKLGPCDRLLGPVALMRALGGPPPAHFALGAAAALLYGFHDGQVLAADAQAASLRSDLDREGLTPVLQQVCGLHADDEFAQAVASRYRGFVFLDDGVRFPPARPGSPSS